MSIRVILTMLLLGISLILSMLYISPLVHLASAVNHLIWQAWLFLKAFDQKLLWFLLSISLLIIFCLRLKPAIAGLFSSPEKREELITTNMLQNWTDVFSGALNRKDNYARWNLAEHLFSLYSQFFHYRYGINQIQFKKALQSGNSDLPSDIATYLKTGCQPFTSLEKKSPFSIGKKPYPLDLNPEQVIAYLEELYKDDS